ncbi:hypothetical protein CLV59_10786 [Chitinophaga dinghuensis]|uniref:Uncharacterized protein n=1 Tax=Chitinophaga dinghuensis TaxID=1539050 RepID=A0A327VTF9_9BACT|nr:hypothetical protein CLV59_10786 [Chitinophaga dinghuensis]
MVTKRLSNNEIAFKKDKTLRLAQGFIHYNDIFLPYKRDQFLCLLLIDLVGTWKKVFQQGLFTV